MNVVLENSARNLVESDIIAVEKKFNISFPKEIKEFYLSHNGGCPTPHLFQKEDELYSINHIFPMKYSDEYESLEDIYDDLVSEEYYKPKHLIPFAVDAGGDYYCFSIKPTEIGKIYCFVQEYYDDENKSIVYLSKNISDFLNSLIEED